MCQDNVVSLDSKRPSMIAEVHCPRCMVRWTAEIYYGKGNALPDKLQCPECYEMTGEYND